MFLGLLRRLFNIAHIWARPVRLVEVSAWAFSIWDCAAMMRGVLNGYKAGVEHLNTRSSARCHRHDAS